MKNLGAKLRGLIEVCAVLVLIMVIIPATWVISLFAIIVITIALIKLSIQKLIF